VTAPAFPLRAVVLGGLADAYWYRRAVTEGCPDCRASATGMCLMHENDDLRAREYETAGHIIRQAAGDGDALAALARAWRGRPGRVLAVLRGGSGRTR
jgi:hypothetical protein